MDSLLASYASSDEEEHEEQPEPSKAEAKGEHISNSTSKPAGIFNSLPPPKSSIFNSLPPPKSQSFANPKPQQTLEQRRGEVDEQIVENPKPKSLSSSSLFSSLPTPKSSSSSLFSSLPPPNSSSSTSSNKRVVQFRPPTIVNPYSNSINDEDEDEEEDVKERQRKRSKESVSTSSAMSFLSSIPAPKHSGTLGALPSALGSGRRLTVETVSSAPTGNIVRGTGTEAEVHSSVEHSEDQSNESRSLGTSHVSNGDSPVIGGIIAGSEGIDYEYPVHTSSEGYAHYTGYVADYGNKSGPVSESSVSTGGNDAGVGQSYAYLGSSGSEYYSNYDGYAAGHDGNPGPGAVHFSYGNDQHVAYANAGGSYGGYDNNAQYENNVLPEASGLVGNVPLVPGKKGRKDAPMQIVEVKQDELMKNRPREDQIKATGIAFGPAYQPAPTKGKPNKLHKRKHQIGALYFDMRQKELELAERRAQGFKTKAETQSKYGW